MTDGLTPDLSKCDVALKDRSIEGCKMLKHADVLSLKISLSKSESETLPQALMR